MPGWVAAAGLGSIALTALLTFVLWRLNAPANERTIRRDGGDSADGAVFPVVVDGTDRNGGGGTFDGGSDGGGDGGGE